jgi:iron complex transport system ATP-binding protein
MGLMPAHAGRILFNHQPLTTFSRKTRARQLGLLLQETKTPFPLQIYEYCQHATYPLASSEHESNIQAALRLVDLTQQQHQSLTTLSGGERKRAALAALFIQNPDFYLLDEPANHLDLKHQQQLLRHLIQQTEKGLLLSTHDLIFAKNIATHVLLLFNDGTHVYGPAKNCLTEPLLSRLYETTLCFNPQTCHTQATISGVNSHDN